MAFSSQAHKVFDVPGPWFEYLNDGEVDLKSGTVVSLGGLYGVLEVDTPVGKIGCAKMVGMYSLRKEANSFAVGGLVYWKADGDPVEGGGALAGTGAATDATADDLIGQALAAASQTDERVLVCLMPEAAAAVAVAEG
jgi:predicted RecA/RadA family phage recombinase